MKQPQEIEVWYVLPAIRRELCICLKNEGLPQKKIAKLLNITDSAVSQYTRSKRAKMVKFNNKLKNKIKQAAKNIKKEGACSTKEMQKICSLIKKTGVLCTIHKRVEKVSCNCEVCMK